MYKRQPAINEVLDGLTKEELIKKMVSVEFNRFINYYKKKRDLSGEKGSERGERSSEPREIRAGDPVRSVSYTHLDGYKRQEL